MKYFLKNNEFSLAMQFLAGMVQLESDSHILDVSSTTESHLRSLTIAGFFL